MALGIYIEAEGTSRNGYDYRLRIYKDGYTGSVISATFAGDMFRIAYEPETDDIAATLIPSSAKIKLVNTSALQTAVADFLTEQQSRTFAVQIDQDRGTGYAPFWRGALLQDEFRDFDRSGNYEVEIAATDGLALLEDLQYTEGNTTAGNPQSTAINDVLRYCLANSALSDGLINTALWGAGDAFLTISADWWEDNQTYAALGDPLDEQVFDVRAWKNKKTRPDGFIEENIESRAGVLRQLCKVYLARFYQSQGRYVFEQIPLRANQNVKQITYNKSGGQLAGTAGAALNNLVQTLPGSTLNAARISGNEYLYFPALKQVQVEMSTFASNANDVGITLPYFGTPTTRTVNLGVFAQSNTSFIGGTVNQALILNFDFLVYFDFAITNSDIVVHGPSALFGYVNLRPKIRATVKLDDINSATDYYFDGNSWVTSSAFFEVEGFEKSVRLPKSTSSATFKYRSSDNVTQVIQTPDLPATGLVTVTLEVCEIERLTAFPNTYQSVTAITDPPFTNVGGNVEMRLQTVFDRGNTVKITTLDNSDANIVDNQIAVIDDLQITDGFIQTGAIFIRKSSVNYVADKWAVGNGSEDINLAALLAKQRLEIQKKPVERYSGAILSGLGYEMAIEIDSAIYLPLTLEFIARANLKEGVWVKIGLVPETSSTASDNLNNVGRTAIGPGTTPYGFGKNSNLPNGKFVVNGMVYDDNLDAFVHTATALLDKGQRNNIEELTASAAGSDTIGVTNTVILLSWSGGNGTYTLTIPDPENVKGARMEIILDGTFDSNKVVAITPANNSIQGGAELQINGAYTRQLLRAIGTNWY